MSLETKIEALTAAVIALTAKLEFQNVPVPVPVAQVQIVSEEISSKTINDVPVSVPAVPAMPAMPAMPAIPTFTSVVTDLTGAPFNDSKGLIEYVMGSYKTMGPVKGASIQGVLTKMGYANINDVKPEHYGDLYAGVEALK